MKIWPQRFKKILLLGLLLPALAQFCKPTAKGDFLMIIFASPVCVIVRGGQEVPARAGQMLQKADVLQTRAGTIDVQSKNGVTVRLREFTTVRVTDLQSNARGQTQMELSNGSLLARVKKSGPENQFSVITPTAIAGVRGTTFSVEVEEGQRPRVKVLDGKVALRPRVNTGEDTAGQAAELNELDRALREAENVLEAGQEGTIQPALDQRLTQLNATVTAKTATAADIQAVRTSLASDLKKDEKPVRTETKGVSAREEADVLMMVSVREELLEKAATGADVEKIAPAVEASYNQSLEESVKNVKSKLESQGLKSEAELAKQYAIVERLTLIDGETLTGAVVAQAGNILVVHTAQGVVQKKKSEVDFVDVITK